MDALFFSTPRTATHTRTPTLPPPPTVPPFIDGADEVTDNTVIINSPLELECQATGTPAPVIT